jgi:Tfp pilus assembly protein PilN
MLRTNLATRPFYNARAVRIGLGVIVLLAGALTAFNVAQVYTLNARNSELNAEAEAAEARAASLREQARKTRQTLNKEEVLVVRTASQEANLLIERRAFSWTDLFNHIEETLPAEVRIAAVQPQMDEEGRMLVAMTAIARRFEDLSDFAERLEQTGAFQGVISRTANSDDQDEVLRMVIQGYYNPPLAPPATAPSSTSESGNGVAANTSGNRSTPPAGPNPPGGGAR